MKEKNIRLLEQPRLGRLFAASSIKEKKGEWQYM